jgi:hypothetical protein
MAVDRSRWYWLLLVPIAIFAVAYGWLLFRGPFERDFQAQRGAQAP